VSDPLEHAIRDHYGDQRLPAPIRARLLALPRPQRRRWRVPAAVASIAAILLALIVLRWFPADDEHLAGPHEIAEMIAAHHLMAQPSSYESETLTDLGRAMPRLDFAPRLSERLERRPLTIEGARYCSVSGRIAMQVALREGDERLTLYLAGPVPRIPDAGGPYRTRINGVQVSLWREGEHFYGLAEPVAPPPSTTTP